MHCNVKLSRGFCLLDRGKFPQVIVSNNRRRNAEKFPPWNESEKSTWRHDAECTLYSNYYYVVDDYFKSREREYHTLWQNKQQHILMQIQKCFKRNLVHAYNFNSCSIQWKVHVSRLYTVFSSFVFSCEITLLQSYKYWNASGCLEASDSFLFRLLRSLSLESFSSLS